MWIHAVVASTLLSASVNANWAQSLMTFVLGNAPPAPTVSLSLPATSVSPLAMIGGSLYEQALRTVELTSLRANAKAESVVENALRVVETAHIRPYWFVDVHSPEDIKRLQSKYGVTEQWFRELNPGVDLDNIAANSQILFYRFDPEKPASSYGRANAGRLVNGMPMPDGDAWIIRNHREAWGTPDVIRYLVRGYEHIHAKYPDRSPAVLGDISYPRGGRISPHKSHRTGRDVDAAYYGLEGAPEGNFWHAVSPKFDVERNWDLFKYWLEQDIVEYIFVDTRLQRALITHALSIGEDPDFVRASFAASGNPSAPIRHARGHADHYHVRFRCEPSDRNCR